MFKTKRNEEAVCADGGQPKNKYDAICRIWVL